MNWKLASAVNIALHLILAHKSEQSLNDEDVSPQAFNGGISNKPRSFKLCEKKLHKRSSIKAIHSGTLVTLTISHYNGFLKLVEAEALLQIHPCFFSHTIRQRVLSLSLSAITL